MKMIGRIKYTVILQNHRLNKVVKDFQDHQVQQTQDRQGEIHLLCRKRFIHCTLTGQYPSLHSWLPVLFSDAQKIL